MNHKQILTTGGILRDYCIDCKVCLNVEKCKCKVKNGNQNNKRNKN